MSNTALKQKVEIMREQAASNMKMALMKVPGSWGLSTAAQKHSLAKSSSSLCKSNDKTKGLRSINA